MTTKTSPPRKMAARKAPAAAKAGAKPAPAAKAPKAAGAVRAKARGRAPGRPGADQADQRERLLDAALASFVSKGIAATSLKDIAQGAGVTPALVHYYFNDKPQLQQTVIAERLMPVIGQLRGPVSNAADGDIAELIAGFVQGVVNVVAGHPWLPTLWVREILSEGGALRDMMLQQVGPVIPKMMAARFAQAQKEGRLNPDLDPRLLMVSLIGLTLFPLAGAPIWRALFGADDIDFNDLRRHTLVLLDRGLELGHEN